MQNLTVPFTLFQQRQCSFRPSIADAKLFDSHKIFEDPELARKKKQQLTPKQNYTFELDSVPQDLLLLSDRESGALVVCGQETYISTRKDGGEKEMIHPEGEMEVAALKTAKFLIRV